MSLSDHSGKNIKNALWSIPNLNPPELVQADIMHNVLLRVLKRLMDWIQGFLECKERINEFDYVSHRLTPYPGFSVPTNVYLVVSQWSGKEIHNFVKVIVGTLTTALRRNAGQARQNRAQLQEFNKAIRCIRSIIKFYLMT